MDNGSASGTLYPYHVAKLGAIHQRRYLKNAATTEEAFAGGWFHSGDLGKIQKFVLRERTERIE